MADFVEMKRAVDTASEYIVYPEYLTARCCRDWPHSPALKMNACVLCGERPKVINEPYKRLRTFQDPR